MTTEITRRLVLKASLLTAAAGLPSAAYVFGVEPHALTFPKLDLPIRNLPETMKNKTLIHISDLHVGPRVSDAYLIESLERIADHKPDIIAITGDLISYVNDAQIDQLRKVMRHFVPASMGSFAVLGNHDYGHGWNQRPVARKVAAVLEDAGIRVLINEVDDVGGLKIAGLGEFWAGEFHPEKVFPAIGSQPAIALSHNPDTLDEPGWGEFRGWTLAGHTHGGQVRAPFLPPPITPVRNKRYTSGTFEFADGRFALYQPRVSAICSASAFVFHPRHRFFVWSGHNIPLRQHDLPKFSALTFLTLIA